MNTNTENNTQTQKILIYSTETCTYCHHLKDYLTEKGFSYEEIDIAKDREQMKIAVQKSGQMGVPVTDIDGKIIVGFDRVAINEILNIK